MQYSVQFLISQKWHHKNYDTLNELHSLINYNKLYWLAEPTFLKHLKHYCQKFVWVTVIFTYDSLHYVKNIFKVCKELGDDHITKSNQDIPLYCSDIPQ